MKKDLCMKMDFFPSICLLYFDRLAVKTFEAGSKHLYLRTRVLFQKNWFCSFLVGINMMTKGHFCAYIADTFRFIQWRSLSDSASKCFISTSVFSEIGMQKNLSVVNRCGILFQSAVLVDFAVFLLITALSWNECFKTTSSHSSASLRAATHGYSLIY